MKSKILLISAALVFIISCKDKPESDTKVTNTENEKIENNLSLKGTWELTKFYNYKNNVVVDSFMTSSDSRQLRMYTETKVIWCKQKPADSSEWFGYGTYNYKDDILTEVLEFGSSVMDQVIAENKEFKFELRLYPNRFEQIELDEDDNRIYSENYVRVE